MNSLKSQGSVRSNITAKSVDHPPYVGSLLKQQSALSYIPDLLMEGEAEHIIDTKLPDYFHVKATHHQISMIKGRHPSSLPKDSELWHYSKVSNHRRSRIQKGHSFWDVVQNTTLESTAKEPFQDKPRRAEDDDSHSSFTPSERDAQFTKRNFSQKIKKEEDVHLLKGSIKNQLKNAMDSKMDDLEVKVDFVHQNQINYGMTFMIVNYANEVMYVDKQNQIRSKHISEVQPYDRIKFKMIDLTNPSNPRAIEYGDNFWIQCLDVSENADNSFSVGSVLTTQLFEPPELSAVQFEDIRSVSNNNNNNAAIPKSIKDTTNPTEPTKKGKKNRSNSKSEMDRSIMAEPDEPVISLEREREDKLQAKIREQREKEEKLLRRSQDFSKHIHLLAKRFPNASKSMMILDEDKEDIAQALHDFIDAEEAAKKEAALLAAQQEDDEDDDMSQVADIQPTVYESAELEAFRQHEAEMQAKAANDSANPSHRSFYKENVKKKPSSLTKVASICGQINLNRIVEIRKTETIFQDGGVNLSDEKASRYNSKQSLHLGRWTVHSAMRPDLRVDSRASQRLHPRGLNNPNDNHIVPGFLYSLTPIILQQDQYCLSTAKTDEYKQWPPNSTYIIHHSNHINPDLAAEYEKNYMKFDTDPNSTSSGAATAKVSKGSQENGQGATTARDDMENAGAITPGMFQPTNTQNADGNKKGKKHIAEKDFACLRRIVNRGPPYDFIVDRRCVWKFCLFEQFSDNSMALSAKEKQATKLMETASMALKLSKMNREGARIHFQSNPDQHLPPLVGGETFPKTLREITFKTAQKYEKAYLRERRVRELKLEQYFAKRIQNHIEKHEVDHGSPKSGRSTPKRRESHDMMILGGDYDEDENMAFSGNRKGGMFGSNSITSFSPPSSPPQDMNNTTWLTQGIAGIGPLEHAQSFDSCEGAEEIARTQSKAGRKNSVAINISGRTRKGSMDSTLSIMSGNASSKPPPKQVAVPPSSTSANNSPNPKGMIMQREESFATLPSLSAQVSMASISHEKTYSADIERVFGSPNIKPPANRMLVLNNVQAVRHFSNLSPGEQVLAFHKTMNHLNVVAERKFNASLEAANTVVATGYTKPKPVNPNVLKKIDILKQEDDALSQVRSLLLSIITHCHFLIIQFSSFFHHRF